MVRHSSPHPAARPCDPARHRQVGWPLRCRTKPTEGKGRNQNLGRPISSPSPARSRSLKPSFPVYATIFPSLLSTTGSTHPRHRHGTYAVIALAIVPAPSSPSPSYPHRRPRSGTRAVALTKRTSPRRHRHREKLAKPEARRSSPPSPSHRRTHTVTLTVVIQVGLVVILGSFPNGARPLLPGRQWLARPTPVSGDRILSFRLHTSPQICILWVSSMDSCLNAEE